MQFYITTLAFLYSLRLQGGLHKSTTEYSVNIPFMVLQRRKLSKYFTDVKSTSYLIVTYLTNDGIMHKCMRLTPAMSDTYTTLRRYTKADYWMCPIGFVTLSTSVCIIMFTCDICT